MRFAVLASGSSGNACYVETGRARILVDAGLSGREVVSRLEAIGVDAQTIDALVITHEHLDHIKGVGPLARRFNIPVFANHPTFEKGSRVLGALPKPVCVSTGQSFCINDLSIETFTKCHDAADPVGLILSSTGVRLGLLTDLGRSTAMVEDRLQNCHALIVEFNHDERMLEEGPYPLELKRRIKGPDGHLSNLQAGRLIRRVAHGGLGWVALAHLSEVNNLPDKALRSVREALDMCPGGCAEVMITEQHKPGPMIELE